MKSYFCDRCPTQLPSPIWEKEMPDELKKFVVKITIRRVSDGDYADLCADCFEEVVQEATFVRVKA